MSFRFTQESPPRRLRLRIWVRVGIFLFFPNRFFPVLLIDLARLCFHFLELFKLLGLFLELKPEIVYFLKTCRQLLLQGRLPLSPLILPKSVSYEGSENGTCCSDQCCQYCYARLTQ